MVRAVFARYRVAVDRQKLGYGADADMRELDDE